MNNPYIIKPSGQTLECVPEDGKKFTLEEAQSIVKGYVQMSRFMDGSNRIILIDEDGKLKHKEANAKATEIAIAGNAISSHDYIVGDALICHTSQF